MSLPIGYENPFPGIYHQVESEPFSYSKDYVCSTKLSYKSTAFLRLGYLFNYLPIKSDWNVLDYGAGRGLFVSVMRKACPRVVGFDVVEGIDDDLVAGPEFLSSMKIVTWDLVTFFDSIEHCEDIDDTLSSFKTDNICISVPELPEKRFEMWWLRCWPHFKPNEHLWYFTASGLREFVKRHGFQHIYYQGNIEDGLRKPWDKRFPNINTIIAGRG
jgi:hypothetical protein